MRYSELCWFISRIPLGCRPEEFFEAKDKTVWQVAMDTHDIEVWRLEAQSRCARRLARDRAVASRAQVLAELADIQWKAEQLEEMRRGALKQYMEGGRKRAELGGDVAARAVLDAVQAALRHGFPLLVIALTASAVQAAANGESPEQWSTRLLTRHGGRALGETLVRGIRTLHRQGPLPWPRDMAWKP